MYIVAIHYAPGTGKAMVPGLADALDKTLYEARARLSNPEGGPAVVGNFAEIGPAYAFAGRLRANGILPILLAPEEFESNARRLLVRSFRLGEQGITAGPRASVGAVADGEPSGRGHHAARPGAAGRKDAVRWLPTSSIIQVSRNRDNLALNKEVRDGGREGGKKERREACYGKKERREAYGGKKERREACYGEEERREAYDGLDPCGSGRREPREQSVVARLPGPCGLVTVLSGRAAEPCPAPAPGGSGACAD